MQVFPERIINLWNKYEVRGIVLLSLVLQIILIVLGNRRKLTASFWIRIIVWSAYMSADWVATVALGNLASSIEDSKDSIHVPNNALQEFWAPFLLLHLGGPDTITAYSLEDNETWSRHVFGLIIQVGVAFYVFLRSWGNTALTFLTIPIFISGVIKYGERTYALMSSSSQHFKDSLPSSPDSCQDFVRYTRGERVEESGESGESEEEMVIPQDGIHTEDHNLVLAYLLFNRTKIFFAEGTLNMYEKKLIYSIIKNKSTAEAFKLVAVELGFMYDVFYTKAVIVYSRLGIILRCITFFFSVSSLVIFSTIIDTHVYPITDISISYLLLVGAVLLELYELIIFFLTDWAKLWLIKLQRAQNNSLSKRLANLFQWFFDHSLSLLTNKWWSESMGQYNLISSCLKVQPAYFGVQKLPFMGKLLERKYLTWIDVNSDHPLQEKILGYLKQLGAELLGVDDKSSHQRRDLILRSRGNFALIERYGFDELTSEWSTINVEFVDSLILWHIATDICFYDELYDDDLDCKCSKYLSDYMLYLLVFRPFMLPKAKGIGEIRLHETSDEIRRIFKKSNRLHGTHIKSNACEALLQNYLDLLPKFKNLLGKDEKDADDFNEFFKGRSQSMLKYGLMVSTQLQNEPRKWKIISDVWVEMLVYAAHNCGWKQHAQQLGKGGELLTHVCLLMAHFGFTKQYVSTHSMGYTPEGVKIEYESM